VCGGHIIGKDKRAKTCGVKCIKRRWYNKNVVSASYFKGDAKFWKTETGIGLKGEAYVAKLLGAKMLLFNKFGADLDWDGKLIDVKTAHLNFRKNKRGVPVKSSQDGFWCFHHTGKEKLIDFVFCLGLDKNGNVAKRLLIPFNEYPKTGATVGHKSKYDKYAFRP
jgi:hypothetical protein